MPLRDTEPQGSFLLSGLFFLSCLSIAAFKLTSWFSSSGLFAAQAAAAQFDEIIVQMGAMILLVVVECRCSYTARQASVVLGLSALMQAAGSWAMFSPVAADEGLAAVALVLRGVGSAAFLLGFGRLLGSIEPVKSALIIAGAEVVGGVASFAFVALPGAIVPLVSATLPLAGALCLIWATEKSGALMQQDAPLMRMQLRKIPVHPVVLLALCALSTVGASLLSPGSSARDDVLYQFLRVVIPVAIFCAYLIWVYGLKRSDPDTLWPFLMTIIFIGLFTCSAFLSIAPDFSFAVVGATQRTLMVFAWVFMASTIYQLRLSPIPCFCLGQLVFSQMPHALAFCIEMCGVHVGSQDQELFATAMMALMALGVIAGVLVVVWKSGRGRALSAPADLSERVPQHAVDCLAMRYELTNRETEVALLLVQGCTLKETGEELVISLDTVRSHAKNLYRKCGIHKRQELVSLVREQMGEGPGDSLS